MKVLLFDIDGTLIRAGGAGRKALNRAGEILYGVKDCCSEVSLAGRTDLFNFGAAAKFATGRKASRAAVEKLHQEYLRQLPRFVRAAINDWNYEVPAGRKVLLKRLSKDKRVLLGLGTGNMEKGARIKLEPSGFNPYFQFGGYGSDSYHRHLLLRKAVARAKKLSPERFTGDDVYVIGDTPFDVAAGKKSGYKTIGVGTGFADWSELKKSKPDYLAKDFRGLGKWLSWFELS